MFKHLFWNVQKYEYVYLHSFPQDVGNFVEKNRDLLF